MLSPIPKWEDPVEPILQSLNTSPSPEDQVRPRYSNKYDQRQVKTLKLEKKIKEKWGVYLEEQHTKSSVKKEAPSNIGFTIDRKFYGDPTNGKFIGQYSLTPKTE